MPYFVTIIFSIFRHRANFWAFTGPRRDFGLLLLTLNMIIHQSFTGATHLLSANVRGPVNFAVSAMLNCTVWNAIFHTNKVNNNMAVDAWPPYDAGYSIISVYDIHYIMLVLVIPVVVSFTNLCGNTVEESYEPQNEYLYLFKIILHWTCKHVNGLKCFDIFEQILLWLLHLNTMVQHVYMYLFSYYLWTYFRKNITRPFEDQSSIVSR